MLIDPFKFGSAASPFFPTNGVMGEPAANASLRLLDASNADYYVPIGTDWTCELYFRIPQTVEENDALLSSNPIVVANNLLVFSFNEESPVVVSGIWNINFAVYNASGGVVVNAGTKFRFKQGATDRRNIHCVFTQEDSGGGALRSSVYFNGILIYQQNIVTTGPDQLGFNFLTDRNFGTRYTDASIYLARFYTSALSASEIRSLYNKGKLRSAITTPVFDFKFDNRIGNDFASGSLKLRALNFTNIASNMVVPVENTTGVLLVFQGNSLTEGFGATPPNSYPRQVYIQSKATETSLEDTFSNYLVDAVGGRTTTQCIARFYALDRFRIDKSIKTFYIPWEITNELNNGVSATDAYNNYITLCSIAKSAGFIVIAVTVLPRVSSNPNFESDRLSINAQIRTDHLMYAHGIADIGDDPVIGQTGANLNPPYTDGVHLDDDGYNNYVAPTVLNAILPLI